MTVRILVTVSRSWTAFSTMRSVLQRCYLEHPEAVLVHGAAPKGDSDAAGIWRGLGGEVEAWPAKWTECDPDCRHRPTPSRHCPYAGYRRNLAMVESAPDLLVAFINRNSRGATHCAKAAEDAGIPTVYYRQGES
jgi:hypothetical protein